MTAEPPHASRSVADGESPEFLQRRLVVFTKVMFVAFVILRLFEFVIYRAYPAVLPNHYWTIFTIGAASVGVLAIAWLILRGPPCLDRSCTPSTCS